MRCGSSWFALLALLLVVIAIIATAQDQTQQEGEPPKEPNEKKQEKPPPEKDNFNPREHKDWGSYYDPQNEFCGRYDCYKILGFDYESYKEGEKPEKSRITKRYRALSRVWHPDKNKAKDAKDRFVKIARAYEVLTNDETRKEYDDLRYDQEAYYQKYGSGVLYKFAPKSDVMVVTVLLLFVVHVVSWFIQKQRWQNVANRLIRASLEDWHIRDGGTPESKELRERALQIMEEREKGEDEKDKKKMNGNNHSANGSTNKSTNGKHNAATSGNGNSTTPSPVSKRQQKRKSKLTSSEKKKMEQDKLRPIIVELVNEMKDFGAGYHQPTWKDLLIVRLAQAPIFMGKALVWNAKYLVNRLRKLELTKEEREVLTRRALGEVIWVSATEEEREEMITLDLWESENRIEWEMEQQVRMLSASEQKKYLRMKKKGKGKEFLADPDAYKYD